MTEDTAQPKKVKRPTQRRGVPRPAGPTAKQRSALEHIIKNIEAGNPKSMVQVLIEAGYSPVSAKQYTHIMTGLKPHLDPVVQKMTELREAAMEHMVTSLKTASYADASRAVHTLTHNIRLLSGKSTQNVGMVIEDKRRKELDALIEA